MAFLLVVAGSNEGDFHPLKKRSVSIGRSEECTIQIVDVEVSRRHMQVHYDEVSDGYLAVDEDSANGVFVNDAEIAGEMPLANGDIIRIGDSEIIYSEKDFIDRDSALEHYRRRTEHDRGTVIQ